MVIGTATTSARKDVLSSKIAPVVRPRIPVPTSLPPTPAVSSDVTQCERNEKISEVQSKFKDVFSVNTNCEDFLVNLNEYSDEVNVKGRLHTPDAIKFFEHIGASEFVLKALREGHHPRLKKPFPDFEFKNNASFCKHQEFAEQEILKLLAKGQVEIVKERPSV